MLIIPYKSAIVSTYRFYPILVLSKYKSEEFQVDFPRWIKKEITFSFFIIKKINI